MNHNPFGFVSLTALIILYLIPIIVALRKDNNSKVIMINMFLGWTVIGWFIALGMAFGLPRKSHSQSCYWLYHCEECGYKKTFDQKLRLFKCPQCFHDNFYME